MYEEGVDGLVTDPFLTLIRTADRYFNSGNGTNGYFVQPTDSLLQGLSNAHTPKPNLSAKACPKCSTRT